MADENRFSPILLKELSVLWHAEKLCFSSISKQMFVKSTALQHPKGMKFLCGFLRCFKNG
ncbi:MAG: hypothetical protein HYW27_02640 [Candidatus Aenigmarchaeota archaeon]|nr:hypothetical protein [Candidatus Aenigmarchaeota archaeon]